MFYRILLTGLVAGILCGCSQPNAALSPTALSSPTEVATAEAATVVPITPAAELPTEVAPTALPPTPTPPTTTPTPNLLERGLALREGPFDVKAQTAALLPAFRSDLDRADEWNQYTISAEIDPISRTVTGKQQLTYTNRDTVALEQLYFHLYPNHPAFAGRLEVSNVTIDGQAVSVGYEGVEYVLQVDLPALLPSGESVVVMLDFTTQAPENASTTAYGAFNSESGVFSLASSYPIAAIVRDGVWDIQPLDSKGDFVNSETALYDVTLTAPVDWIVITTGVTVETQRDNQRQAARFVSGPQRDFMISLTQFPSVSAEVDGTRVTSYYRPGGEAAGQEVLDVGVESLRIFNQRYGQYPLVELDVVEFAATTFLGVEYPGLILIERTLYDQSPSLETTVVHEVAHQWWYSLIGNDVQTAAWIDEGLASFSQIVYQEEFYGPEGAENELQRFRTRYDQTRDAGGDAPLDQPNAAFQQNYVPLVYGKSVLFFQALREQIGEEALGVFLQGLYEQRYNVLTGDDVLVTAEMACTCELDALYTDWVTTANLVEIP
ncbi:MAG: M1 family peptidase [Chloroflexi bacterium AL-W]|nr:M1 family peptidase [Chloroflexi bacterium AL-N1]NOK68056.1 M1 family peptidase [Chloroflexi bacterium AL-N10]NOK73396.1 M1 family peptidase [Chloroflexi bacterium AL-N5]NOK83310.1 M1 family peptidase [Chloroflexi bacterium AL-W]NOK87727.1 M1 family peptidase [Chloroflexi bacterium AL-N15]